MCHLKTRFLVFIERMLDFIVFRYYASNVNRVCPFLWISIFLTNKIMSVCALLIRPALSIFYFSSVPVYNANTIQDFQYKNYVTLYV